MSKTCENCRTPLDADGDCPLEQVMDQDDACTWKGRARRAGLGRDEAWKYLSMFAEYPCQERHHVTATDAIEVMKERGAPDLIETVRMQRDLYYKKYRAAKAGLENQ